ncbi:MAG: hypothetical protein HRU19_33150 [Pseudobacteriovorax sp.]|nr:hypothetical protein [Pseudobacteriovorax sp.]
MELIRKPKKAELDVVAQFISEWNKGVQLCLHTSRSVNGIIEDFSQFPEPWYAASMIGIKENSIVAVFVLDVDYERQRAWCHGPFYQSNRYQYDDIKSLMEDCLKPFVEKGFTFDQYLTPDSLDSIAICKGIGFQPTNKVSYTLEVEEHARVRTAC